MDRRFVNRCDVGGCSDCHNSGNAFASPAAKVNGEDQSSWPRNRQAVTRGSAGASPSRAGSVSKSRPKSLVSKSNLAQRACCARKRRAQRFSGPWRSPKCCAPDRSAQRARCARKSNRRVEGIHPAPRQAVDDEEVAGRKATAATELRNVEHTKGRRHGPIAVESISRAYLSRNSLLIGPFFPWKLGKLAVYLLKTPHF